MIKYEIVEEIYEVFYLEVIFVWVGKEEVFWVYFIYVWWNDNVIKLRLRIRYIVVDLYC